MITQPSGSLVVHQVDGSDNFIETILTSQELPITTTGTDYSNLGITGDNVQDAFDELVDSLQVPVLEVAEDTHEPMGFIDRTSSTIAFDSNTRTFTVAPVSDSFDIYSYGTKYTKTTSSGTIPDVTAAYFFYYDENGDFTQSATVWDIFTDTPVAAVYWSSTMASGILLEERHGIIMDSPTHYHLHHSQSTFVVSGFTIDGYEVNPNTPSSATNSFSIATGEIADEDILLDIPELADGGPYAVLYRGGVSGEWLYEFNTLPYTQGSSYIEFNELNGGTWGLTELSNSNYVNYYVLATNAVDTALKYIILPGQDKYTSEADALEGTIADLTFGDLPFAELASLYQITYETNASYSTSIGKCRIVNVRNIIGTESIAVGGGTGAGDHSALSGRTSPNSHPSTAISTATSGAVLYSSGDTIGEDTDLIWEDETSTLRVNGTVDSTDLDVSNSTTLSGSLQFYSGAAPASAGSAGSEGEIRYDGQFLYIRLGGQWRRSSISLF